MKLLTIFSLVLFGILLLSFPSQIVRAQEHDAAILLSSGRYNWTEKVYITILVPDHNKLPTVQEYIGKNSDNFISISSSLGKIEGYQLYETNIDTGIFTGEITLTGFPHDLNGDGLDDTEAITSGNGPTDGKLMVSYDDEIKVSFDHFGKSYSSYALVTWYIGEVQWLSGNYPLNSEGTVRVVDPDMDLDPEIIDMVHVSVLSDSDVNGIDLLLIETNEATGIFDGTVFLSNVESSDSTLKVKDGDKITVEYKDKTLPGPFYNTSDALYIQGYSKIGPVTTPVTTPSTPVTTPLTASPTIDPELFNEWMEKGIALHKTGNYEEAITFFDKINEIPWGASLDLSVQVNQINALVFKASSLYYLERFDESNEYYDKYLELAKNESGVVSTDVLFAKGLVLSKLSDHEQALSYFERAYSANPDLIKALYQQGVTLTVLERYEEAIPIFDKVLSIDPNDEQAKEDRHIAIKLLDFQKNSQEFITSNNSFKFANGDEIFYSSFNGIVNEMRIVESTKSLIINLEAYENEIIGLSIPRSILDAKSGSLDDQFIVLWNGVKVKFVEENKKEDPVYRHLGIYIPKGVSDFEIIGTHTKESEFVAYADPKDALPQNNNPNFVNDLFYLLGYFLVKFVIYGIPVTALALWFLNRKFKWFSKKKDSKLSLNDNGDSDIQEIVTEDDNTIEKPTREVFCKDSNEKTIHRKIIRPNETLIAHLCEQHKDHPLLQGEDYLPETWQS